MLSAALLLLHLFFLVERASHDTSDPVYDARAPPPSLAHPALPSSIGQMGAVSLARSLEKAARRRRAVVTRDAATFSVFVAATEPTYRDQRIGWSVVERNLPLLLLLLYTIFTYLSRSLYSGAVATITTTLVNDHG